MRNFVVLAPWPGYTDMGSVNFENSISDNVTEWEAERLHAALSGAILIFKDEESAAREVIRGREGLTNEAHAALIQAVDAAGNARLDWSDAPDLEDGGDATPPDDEEDPSDEEDGEADADETDPAESSTEDEE